MFPDFYFLSRNKIYAYVPTGFPSSEPLLLPLSRSRGNFFSIMSGLTNKEDQEMIFRRMMTSNPAKQENSHLRLKKRTCIWETGDRDCQSNFRRQCFRLTGTANHMQLSQEVPITKQTGHREMASNGSLSGRRQPMNKFSIRSLL